jgi:hypothetical protein
MWTIRTAEKKNGEETVRLPKAFKNCSAMG